MELTKIAALLLMAGVASSVSGLLVQDTSVDLDRLTLEARWREMARKTVENTMLSLTKMLSPLIGGGGGARGAGGAGGLRGAGLGDGLGRLIGGFGGLGGGLGGGGLGGGALGGAAGGSRSAVRNLDIGDGKDLTLDDAEDKAHVGGEVIRNRRKAGVFEEMLHDLQELQVQTLKNLQGRHGVKSGEKAEQTTTSSTTTTTTLATPEDAHNASSKQSGLWISAWTICFLYSALLTTL